MNSTHLDRLGVEAETSQADNSTLGHVEFSFCTPSHRQVRRRRLKADTVREKTPTQKLDTENPNYLTFAFLSTFQIKSKVFRNCFPLKTLLKTFQHQHFKAVVNVKTVSERIVLLWSVLYILLGCSSGIGQFIYIFN